MNYADPSIVLGLLLMGMTIGAFLCREYYRRNLDAILDQEIEKRCRCDGDRLKTTSVRKTQLPRYLAARIPGGHSPGQVH
jgi:hypothetical protein